MHPFFIHGIHFWYQFEIPPEILEPRYYREKEVPLGFKVHFTFHHHCYAQVLRRCVRSDASGPVGISAGTWKGEVFWRLDAVSAWQDPNKFEKYAMKKAAGWGNGRHIMITYILLYVIYIYIY